MLFFIGLILLSCLSSYRIYKRFYGPWEGKLSNVKETPYQYKLEESSYFNNYLYLGIKSNFPADFHFKKEFWYDRIAKQLGFAKEIQMGNQKFDDKIYVKSDNQELYNLFKNKNYLLAEIQAIFHDFDTHTYTLREMRQHNGGLWIKLKVEKDFREVDGQTIAIYLIPKLVEFLEILYKEDTSSNGHVHDNFAIKSSIFLGLGGGLCANSLLHYLFYFRGQKLPLIADKQLLLESSIYYGLIVTILFILFAFLILGRRAKTHIILFELFIILSLGFVSTVYTGIYKFNIEFDDAKKSQYQSQVIRKEVSTRRFSNYYSIKIKNWKNEKKPIKIEVSKQFYNSVKRWDPITINLGSGYLGYEWIESINKG